MLQDNPLLAQLKQQLHAQTPRIEGIVKAHEKGYGFLEVDSKNSRKSYFIPASKMKKLFNGDRVSGTLNSQNEKEFFEPESLIEASLQTFIAKVSFNQKQLLVQPYHISGSTPIVSQLAPEVTAELKEGDWVLAKLISHPLQENQSRFKAEIVTFITHAHDPYALWLITLFKYQLDTEAPYSDINLTLLDSDISLRQDFTDIDFFTIDSESTEDMDDALYIEEYPDYYRLLVAIADPSAFIAADSDLDKQAQRRHFTTYLPDFSVPMLPEVLANQLCSLQAGEKRPAVVAEMQINKQGELQGDTLFSLAWICSKAKLTYNRTADWLESGQIPDTTLPSLSRQLPLLWQLAQLRVTWRQNHALLFKNRPEYHFVLDSERKVIDIIEEPRRPTHTMVEEAMILANQALTDKLANQLNVGIFNVHDGFDSKYAETILKIIAEHGITDFDKEKLASFTGYSELRHRLAHDENLEFRLRRYQLPADFSFTPRPHFGLGFQAYATWTSPIRKYSDLVNHRLLKASIANTAVTLPNSNNLEQMSERRKRVRYAERDISDKLYLHYLAERINSQHPAEIIDINRGGAKVKLTDIGAIAFMPLSFIHPVRDEISASQEEATIKLKGETIYQVADKLHVTLIEANRDTLSIIVKPNVVA